MKTVLSPKELAQAIGVSESSLKRWADNGRLQVTRTLGGHRRIQLAEAVRFIRETNQPVVRPDLLGLSSGETKRRGELTAAADGAFALLCRGDTAGFRSMIGELFLAGQSVASMCDELICPGLRRIGESRQNPQQDIACEHLATDIVIQTLNVIRSMIPNPPDGAPAAVGGAPAGDSYPIPSLMAAATLAEVGYRDVNLGPDLPLGALRAAVEQHRPRLVWLALTQDDPPVTQEELQELAQQLAQSDIHLVLGGRAVDQRRIQSSNHAHIVPFLNDLQGIARHIVEPAHV